MKNKLGIFALILALIFALTACSSENENGADAEEAAERTVLMTVGGAPVYQDDVQYYVDLTGMYYAYGMLDYYYTNLDALQYVIYYDVGAQLLTEGKVETLLGDSYDELYAQYGSEFDGYVEQQKADVLSAEGYSGTEDDAYQEALEYFASLGYTRDVFIAERLRNDAYTTYINGIEVEVSEEEVKAAFDERAEQDRQTYEGNAGMYDYYVQYQGQESYYIPEGYRGILHILIGADETLLKAYADAVDAGDEEAAKAAADAVMESVKETTDEIYAAYEAGTPFTELIAKYNIDTGMQNESNLQTGYLVHKDGMLYKDEFTKGSFSEEMDKPGAVSKPVVTSYGVHILYYLNDVPAGKVELSDEIYSDIESELIGEITYRHIISELKAYEKVYYPAYDEFIGEKNFLDD